MGMTRKKFLNGLLTIGGIGSLGAILYPIFSFMNPPKIAEAEVNSVKAGNAADFSNNSAQIIKFGRKPVILIRTVNGEFKAFSATCTHLDCIVQYKSDSKQILCACHNGLYDLNGRNISGPPPKPLEEFSVRVVKDEIIITQQT